MTPTSWLSTTPSNGWNAPNLWTNPLLTKAVMETPSNPAKMGLWNSQVKGKIHLRQAAVQLAAWATLLALFFAMDKRFDWATPDQFWWTGAAVGLEPLEGIYAHHLPHFPHQSAPP